MKVYNKLVRDKIPEIISETGKRYDIHIAGEEELIGLLEAKMEEEFQEYKEVRFASGKNLEELSDMVEVIFGLAEALGYTEAELLRKREEKKEERGSFRKGIVLESVWE